VKTKRYSAVDVTETQSAVSVVFHSVKKHFNHPGCLFETTAKEDERLLVL
jgi:hypothetical protein